MTQDQQRRDELAAFLRARRSRLRPADVGLGGTGRRRTPGLRRQEVAQLAGISVEYYVRLEQARGAHPSRQVLLALARALMLTGDGRSYLFRLAGLTPPSGPGRSREVSPAIRNLLDSMPGTPAYVVDAAYDILAWNRLATHFIGDLSDVPPEDRNMLRWMFSQPDTDVHWSDEETLQFTRSTIADLRASYARHLGDRRIEGLVTELLALSPRFATMWAEHDVEERRRMVKRIEHPVLGTLAFECQVLHVPDVDQRVIVYCAEPGTATHAAFRRLATSARPPGGLTGQADEESCRAVRPADDAVDGRRRTAGAGDPAGTGAGR